MSSNSWNRLKRKAKYTGSSDEDGTTCISSAKKSKKYDADDDVPKDRVFFFETSLEQLSFFKVSPIQSLPDEVLLCILARLSPRNIEAAESVCSRFRRLSKMVPVYCESTRTLTLNGLSGDSLTQHLSSFPQREHLVCRNVEVSQEMITYGVCGFGTKLKSLKFYGVTFRSHYRTPSEQYLKTFFRALFSGSPLLEEVVWHNVVFRARNALSVGTIVFHSSVCPGITRVQFSGPRLLFSSFSYQPALAGFKNLQALAITDRFRILDCGSFYKALAQLARLRELYVVKPAPVHDGSDHDSSGSRNASAAPSTIFGAVTKACSSLQALQILVATGMQMDRPNVDKVLSLGLQVTLLKGQHDFEWHELAGVGDRISSVAPDKMCPGILRYREIDSPSFNLVKLSDGHRTLSDLKKKLGKSTILEKFWASSGLSDCFL